MASPLLTQFSQGCDLLHLSLYSDVSLGLILSEGFSSDIHACISNKNLLPVPAWSA